jgi:hypothetical protein
LLDAIDPATSTPIPGTSASVLQGTGWGETWYRGLTLSLTKRFQGRYQALASYTLSKAEDNSTDFQGAFVPQDHGFGRNPQDPTGLPIGFDPDAEKGASLQDRRHQFVLSGIYALPRDFQVATIVSIRSGRPYNILAGVDLNGDGDGGTFPADRARREPSNPGSSLPRNVGRLPLEATLDVRFSYRVRNVGRLRIEAIAEVFNLLNRTNFTGVNSVFGTGAYPSQPMQTFGQFDRAAPPRQMQLGLKTTF